MFVRRHFDAGVRGGLFVHNALRFFFRCKVGDRRAFAERLNHGFQDRLFFREMIFGFYRPLFGVRFGFEFPPVLAILLEIVLPQVAGVMLVGLILAFVTMLSVLSVPIMISGGSPTMITVDMAFRVNSYSDYGVANALGFVSYAMAGLAAWVYLRRSASSGSAL